VKVGDLVLIHKDEQWGFKSNQIALVIDRNKSKKKWQRRYLLMLSNGRLFVSPQWLDIEVISVCNSEKTYLKRV
jgi:hypothetical protein